MAYNWDEIKAKYESGTYSMRHLAEEYGFNKDYGYAKSSEEGWVKGRLAERLKKRAADYFYETLEEEVEHIAELKQEYALFVEWIKEAMVKELFQIPIDKDGNINLNESPRLRDVDEALLDKLHKALKILKESKELDWSIFNVKEAPKKVEIEHSGKIKGDKNYNESLIEKIATEEKYQKLAEELYDLERGSSED